MAIVRLWNPFFHVKANANLRVKGILRKEKQ